MNDLEIIIALWVGLAVVISLFAGALLCTCSSDKHMVARLRKAGREQLPKRI